MNDGDYNQIAGLAASINSRLKAEAMVAKAIGFGWICGGVAISSCLTAAGALLAFWGYSYVISTRPAADLTAKALVDAIRRAELKVRVTGNMSLSPNSELSLASGQIITIDDSATVKLDPRSSVRVVGDMKLDIPQPSKQQLQLETRSGSKE